MPGPTPARARTPSLGRRIDRAMAAICVFVVAVGGVVSVVAWRTVSSESRQRDVYEPAAADSATLLASLVDQETGERGYLLTGQNAFLQPYDAGRGRTEALLGRLERRLRGHADLLSALQRIRTAYAAWL